MDNCDERRPGALAFKKHLGEQFGGDLRRTRAAPVAPRLHGAVKATAVRAHTAGGSSGGLRQVVAASVPLRFEMASVGVSLAGVGVAIGCGVARTIGPQVLPVVRIVDPEVRDAELDERGGFEAQLAEVLTESWPLVVELAAEELAADTIVMPVVGDRVHYSRGSGHLIGLQGVVVVSDDGQPLPRGLRYVQLDGEAWPIVVAVAYLDRI
ncbi:hypothetical protein [Curtobacterium sp. MCSS17_005]|uniref:hypothetical protein n=1 Tax=Curtobacterium sp. MCSS17_005 TaxID=2175641 RepID=UPI0024DF43AD|nr:hypothetical protein [Curtobacterium sp. MCSS17_005]WIB32076.1 hypothetical protein DEJ20_13885 [Curtobacterium sp. MCSS17_005]